MPFNGSGTFSVVNTFVPNTVISSSAMNANFTDIAQNGLSEVLTLDGQSFMTGQIKAANGTNALPAFTFNSDLDTGVYRPAANQVAIAVAGAETVNVSSSGLDVVDGDVMKGGAILLPPGLIFPYAGSTEPAGYLFCYGQAISRTTYEDLFNAIGTNYGVGNGTTTFNVPDLRGRVAAGRDDMGGAAASRLTSTTMTPSGIALASVGGTQTHTLLTAEMPAHSHTVTDPGHTHSVAFVQNSTAPGSSENVQNFPAAGAYNSSSATTGITNQNTGGGGAHLNVQPSIITNYIIKI